MFLMFPLKQVHSIRSVSLRSSIAECIVNYLFAIISLRALRLVPCQGIEV